jgi:hypothetical protein
LGDPVDLTERLRSWTHRRQRLGDPAASPIDAVRAVVAVYSAHPTAPLALAARTAALTATDFRALERDRAALRVPGMRGSQFLVPAEHAAMVFAPFMINRGGLLARLRRGGMTEDEYRRISDRVVAAAREPLLPPELARVAGMKGLDLSILLGTMRREGRMLAVAEGSLRAATLRYVTTEAWAPGSLAVGNDATALTDLAGAYLRAFGPARVADFAWWTGANRSAAAAAMSAHETVDVGGGLLLPTADEAAFSRVARLTGTVDLLPKWDSYTMGYAPDGRARLVHPDNQPRIYVRKDVVAPGQPRIGLPGDGYPVVLVDGEAVGTWNVNLAGATVELFDTVGAKISRRLDDRLQAVSGLLAG